MSNKFLDKIGVQYLCEKIKTLLLGKVDKVDGKGLSTNDYTTAEKTKLASFAEASTYATATDLTGKVDKVAGKALSTNDYTTADKTKLAGFGEASTYATQTELGDKVDKVEGKGLSESNYTEAEKTKLGAFAEASSYALKTEIVGVYKYMGNVDTVDDLPTASNVTGHIYNVEATGMNYAWNGTEWDALGEIFTVESITNAEIDAMFTA